jgi:two-component system, OmpR family, response regulator
MGSHEVVRETVLVADDDTLVRSVLRVSLTRSGYTVLEASRAEEVLDVTREFHPALVILDVNMPGGSLHDTLTKLRLQSPRPAVLVLSGESERPDGLTEPDDDFARKPIGHEELLSRIDSLLTTRHGL